MGGSPIALERETVKAIAGQLQAGDRVSAVTWSTTNAVVLDSHAVTGPGDSTVLSMANALQSGGGTNLNGGLTAGYLLAQKNFVATQLNRVVIISDGQANVGVTDKDIIAKGAALNDGDGVYLVGVGVGSGVNDTLMDAVTDAGRGAYVYIDGNPEISRMFSSRFDEVMDVAARAVQVELRMPWYMDIEVFHGEEYSTNPAEVQPQHLAPNDAMVMNQVVRACSASEVLDTDPIEVVARWETPTTHEKKQTSKATTFGDLLAATPAYLAKGAAIIAYAEALKNPAEAKSRLAAAQKAVEAADPAGTDPELSEIKGLIAKALTIY
jgi:Ca-activated chloride channel family protein